MSLPLENRTALVTGGSRGIGAAVALALAEAGANVAVNYCHSPKPAAEVQAQIAQLGRRALAVQADMARCDQIATMFDQVEAQLGPVDILVNNAGIETRQSVESFDEATYDRIMDTNLKGAFFCAQRALPGMQQRGWGRVINVSSVHEITATGFCAVYGISKGGMALLMRELAVAYSRYGITVNNIAPGAIRTDINRNVLADPAYEAKVVAKIPAGYIGEPGDVAGLALFLASHAARYITGATLVIDGGLTLR